MSLFPQKHKALSLTFEGTFTFPPFTTSRELWQTGRTPGSSRKLSQRRFKLDIRKRLFTQRGVGHCNRLPWAVGTAPSLTEFKKH